MKNDLVSIIMPSFNTAKFIERSINSVLNQTYDNWELIIVDDNSHDNTKSIISELKDSRIKLIANKENLGAAYSRNKALRIAKGEWIAFLDSDDLWTCDKLQKQIEFMRNKKIEFSYTAYCVIDENDNVLNSQIGGPKKINKRKMYDYCWPGCLTVMYSAKKIGLIQIENLKKNNDYAIWLKAIEKSECYLLNEVLGYYRKRKGSISNHCKLKLIEHHYYLFRKGMHKNALVSVILTLRNLFYGFIKKIVYK